MHVEVDVSRSIHYLVNGSQGVSDANMFNAVYRERSNLHPNTTGLDQMNHVRVALSAPRLPHGVDIMNQL